MLYHHSRQWISLLHHNGRLLGGGDLGVGGDTYVVVLGEGGVRDLEGG